MTFTLPLEMFWLKCTLGSKNKTNNHNLVFGLIVIVSMTFIISLQYISVSPIICVMPWVIVRVIHEDTL